MIHVDIATKIIAPETSIWVVFPGRGRRFINIFLNQDVIFLETPGLKLRPQDANVMSVVRQHVRMSLAIAEYVQGDSKRVPSRRPGFYSDEVFKDNSQKVFATSVRKMFGKMKVGDLVIVPGRMFAPVYFAEVISEFNAKDKINVERYGIEDIPVRRVRWINTGVPRTVIAPDLQGYLSKPPAISHIQRSHQTDQFFSLAYPAYVLAEKSAVIMNGPKYDGRNPLATHEANYLVAYFISAFSAIEQDRLVEFAGLDVKSAIDAFYDRELVESFTQNYNSPGRSGLALLSAILGAFVSGAIAISLQNLSASEWHSGIEITNSISPADEHIVHDAGVQLQYLFNAMNKKEIDEVNKLAKKAKEHIGLTTPVKVKTKKP